MIIFDKPSISPIKTKAMGRRAQLGTDATCRQSVMYDTYRMTARDIVLFLFVLLSLLSCTSDNEPSVTTTNRQTVTVAVTPTLDCLPFLVARDCAIADSMGIELVLIECGALADCDTALISGHASAIMSDYVRAASLRDKWARLMSSQTAGEKQKRTAGDKTVTASVDSLVVFPHQNSHLYMFVNRKSRIREARQMADKMVAVDRYGADAALAAYVLDSVGLTGKTYLVQMQNINTRVMMIENNMMDVAVVSEPYATLLRKTGHKQIYSAAHVKSENVGCLIARKNHQRIRDMYNRACDSITKNGLHHYDSLLIRFSGVPPKAVETMPRHKFLHLE
ncbi:MAG: hypothetical protein PUH87_04365 [Bacteroidales bacterium]|nr:hypothetical protein [Bacteroidales bacterium]